MSNNKLKEQKIECLQTLTLQIYRSRVGVGAATSYQLIDASVSTENWNYAPECRIEIQAFYHRSQSLEAKNIANI